MWKIDEAPGRILVQPVGHLFLDESAVAAQRLESLIAVMRDPCILIIDLGELTGYDSAVRKLWQETIRRNRDRFRMMVWVSDSPLYRMVAASVSLFTGIPGRVVGSAADPMQVAI